MAAVRAEDYDPAHDLARFRGHREESSFALLDSRSATVARADRFVKSRVLTRPGEPSKAATNSRQRFGVRAALRRFLALANGPSTG